MATKAKPMMTGELIRDILNGQNVPLAQRKLFRLGGDAVEPILHAMTGRHGAAHSDRRGHAVEDLMKVLVTLAKKDVTPLAAALAHHVPGVHAVVWAIGHSPTDHATDVLRDLAEHGDESVQMIAEHHLSRRKGGPRKSTVSRSTRPPAKKKAVAKKKNPVAKKKAAAGKKASIRSR